ncbi:MAG: molybdenum cofactor biosynthesis protein MoaE [Gemmatimonadota bacterium]
MSATPSPPVESPSSPPPFARITDAPLDGEALLARIAHPSHGAQLLFLGVVRDMNEGKEVEGIRYEAFREMAEPVLLSLLRSAQDQWPGVRAGAEHRFGHLHVGEASVMVAVSSPHRAEAYEASRWIMDELKQSLPVWKEELYRDGESQWLKGNSPVSNRGEE